MSEIPQGGFNRVKKIALSGFIFRPLSNRFWFFAFSDTFSSILLKQRTLSIPLPNGDMRIHLMNSPAVKPLELDGNPRYGVGVNTNLS